MSAQWAVAAKNSALTDDLKVYFDDYESGTDKIKITHGGTKVAKELKGTVTAEKVKVDNGEDTYYEVTITQIGGNYNITNRIQRWYVTRKEIKGTVTPNCDDNKYSGNYYSATISFYGLVNDVRPSSLSGIAFEFTKNNVATTDISIYDNGSSYVLQAKNAGVYRATMNVASPKIDNYLITEIIIAPDDDGKVLVINPRVVTVSFANKSVIYNGTDVKSSFLPTITNRVGSDDVGVEYGYSIIPIVDGTVADKDKNGTWDDNMTVGQAVTEIKHVGAYTVKILSVGNENYTLEGATGTSATCTVTKKGVALSADDITVPDNTYDGTEKSLSIPDINDVTKAYLLAADRGKGYKWTTSGTIKATNVGTYTGKVVGITQSNDGYLDYSLVSVVTKENWTIVRREVTITWFAFNQGYYNNAGSKDSDGFFITAGGAPESGDGKSASPFVYYYNGSVAIDASATGFGDVGVYAMITSGVVDNDTINLTVRASGGDSRFYTNDKNTNAFSRGATAAITSKNYENVRVIACANGISSATRSVTVSIDNDNYKITYAYQGATGEEYKNCYYKISPRPTVLSWSISTPTGGSVVGFNGVYCQQAYTVSATVGNKIPNYDVTVKTYNNNVKTRVGSYTAEATVLSDANYSLPSAKTQAWGITKKALNTVVWGTNVFTYDGVSHAPTATIATESAAQGTTGDGKLYTGDVVSYSYTHYYSVDGGRTWQAAADSDRVIVRSGGGTLYNYKTVITGITGSDANCYSLGNIEDVDEGRYRIWTIERRTLTPIWSNNTVSEYTGGTQTITFSVSGLISSDYSTNVDFTFTLNDGKTEAAKGTGIVVDGTYTITFSAVDAGKYGYTAHIDGLKARSDCYEMVASSKDWEITPVAVTLSWTLDGNTGLNVVTYDATEHIVGATVSNKALGSDDVSVTLDDSGRVEDGRTILYSATNKGSYRAKAIALTGSSAKNYSLTVTNFDWDIGAKVITATWNTGAYTYNGEYQYPSITIDGLYAKDTVYFTLNFFDYDAASNTDSPRANGQKIVTGKGSTQYTFTSSDVDYLGAHVAGETVDAGSYRIKFNGVVYSSGSISEENKNYSYEGALLPGDFYIEKKVVTGTGIWTYKNDSATPSNGTYTHGSTELIYNKSPYVLTTTLDENALCTRLGVPDVAPTIEYKNNVKTAAGNYTATIAVTDRNYKLGVENSNRTWSIMPKEIVIDWKLDGGKVFEKQYDGSNHTVTATAESLCDGDICTINVAGDVTKSTVGSFTATASSVSNVNYKLPAAVSQEWAITQRVVSVIWKLDGTSTSKVTYDSLPHTVTAQVGNLVGSETCYINIGSGSGATVVGSYTAKDLTLSGDNASNYTLTGSTGTAFDWTITKRQLSATFTAESPTYDGNYQGRTITITNIGTNDCNSEKLSFTTTGSTTSQIIHNYGNSEGYTSYVISFMDIDAGDYTAKIATLIGSSAENYDMPNTVETNFSIAKLPVVIVWDYDYFEYDATTHTVTPTVSNLKTRADDGTKDTVTLTYSGNTAVHSGNNYTATVTALSGEDAGNYTLTGATNPSLVWGIAKKAVSVESWNYLNTGMSPTSGIYEHGTTVLTYNGRAFTVTANLSGVMGGDNVSLVYSENVKTNAGTYRATVNLAPSVIDYVMEETTGEWTVEKLTVNVSWSAATFVYDGTEKSVFATAINKAAEDTVTFVYVGEVKSDYGLIEGNAATHAGVYTVTVSKVNDTNYVLPAVAPSVTFTITPRPLSLAFNSVNATYDGNGHGIDLTVGNVVASDLNLFTLDKFTLTDNGCTVSDGTSNGKYYIYFRAVPAGSYKVGVSGFNNTDYSLVPADGSFEIKRREITVSGWNWSDGTDAGNGVYSFVYNGRTFTLTPVASGLVGEESVTLTVSNNTGVNATNYIARASLDESVYTNYKITAVTQHWTITKKEIGITWTLDGKDSFELIYDGTNHTITAEATGLVSGDETGITLGGNVTEKSAGSYTAEATAVSNGNYKLPSDVTKSWTIKQRAVVLAWKLDGENKLALEYDSAVHGVSASVTNVATGDSLAVTLTGDATATVKGAYKAIASEITGTGSSNYTLEGVEEVHGAKYYEWKITAIVLDVAFNGGSFNYDGSLQGITATITKITAKDLLDDAVGFGTTGTSAGVTVTTSKDDLKYYVTFRATQAGTYDVAIAAINGTAADNYELPTEVSSAFVIGKRIITVSWTAEGGVYKAAEYFATATVTNVVAGDTLALSYNTTGNANAYNAETNAATRADAYTTTITGVDNENYTLAGATDVSVGWTITPKILTDFSWSENSFIYDAAAKTIIATVNTESVGSGDVNDGKAYGVDSLSFTYNGTVTTDYGISAVVGNSATNAGVYGVSVAGVNNTDYSVGEVSSTFIIAKAILSASLTDEREFVYDGKQHGITVTVTGIVAENNNNTELYLETVFAGSVGNAIRSGTQFTQFFGGTDADTYQLTATLGGTKKDNYTLADIDTSFVINPKEITTAITANVTTDKLVYSAKEINDGDLGVVFQNVITGESLSLATDYEVSYKNSVGEVMAANPINVGVYTATVTLKNTVRAGNYLLKGTTSFDFAITHYVIKASDLIWSLGNNTINIESLSYVADENKTITVSAIEDEVFNRAGGLNDMTFGYSYFGFCNCGTEARSAADCDHIDHQWLTADNGVGPIHAGTYWVVLSLTGGNSENFMLDGFENYSDANHFAEVGGRTYLTWYGGAENAIESALPVLGNTVVAKQFGIARSKQGITIDFENGILPYKGSYYTVKDGLPEATGMGDGAIVKVSVNSVEYTYDTYAADNFAVVKNAGTYDIQIWDANAPGTITSCDTFSEDAQISYAVRLEITKSKITLTAKSTTAWTKKYDKTTSYTTFDYTGKDVQVVYDKNKETDGVIVGTTVNVAGEFKDMNAGSRELVFTVGGADAANYYLVLNDGNSALTKDTDYTVNGNTYTVKGGTAANNVSNGDGGYIEPRIITVVGDTNKVYDGTPDLANFDITSQDIVAGDSVTVTGIYASANAGTWDITLSTDNINYIISSSVGAQGTIAKAPVSFIWTDNGNSYEYDKLPHGVRVSVSGMVVGHEESIVVSGSETDTFSGNVEKSYVATSVGSYTVALALALGENSNYTIEAATTTGRWTITPRTVTIDWVKDDYADGMHIYDWQLFDVVYSNIQRKVTPVVRGLLQGDKVDIVTSGTNGTDVGNYVSAVNSLTGEDKDNYKLPAVTEQSWSISKASITNLTMSDATFTYNKGVNGITVNTTTSQHGVPLNVVYEGGTMQTAGTITGNNAAINVGTYKITASVAATANYEAWSSSAVLKITKATISGITMSGANVVYDKTAHSVSVSTATTSLGDVLSVKYRIIGTTEGGVSVDEEGNSAIDAGKYTVTATLTDDNDNYIEKEFMVALVIATRSITVNWSDTPDAIWIYNGTEQGKNLTVSNIIEGDTVTVNLKKEFDGVVSNVMISDSDTYTYTAINASASGYYLTITGLTGSSASNYTLPSNLSASFDIAKRSIMISGWSDGVNTYNDSQSIAFVYSKTAHVINPVYSATDATTGILEADRSSVTINVTENDKTEAGTYSASAVLVSNKNYSMTPSSRAWEITPKEVTVTWTDDTSKIYNAQVQTIEASIIGLIEGDGASLTYKDNAEKDVGSYTASVVSIDNHNYKLAEPIATLSWTISKADITGISMSDKTVVYDGTAYELTVSGTKTQYDEPVSVVYTMINDRGETITGGKTSNAGVYTVTAVLDGGNNYNETSIVRTLTIEKKALSFSWSNTTSFTYNAAPQGLTLTVNGIVSGDEITLHGYNGESAVTKTITSTSTLEFKAINADTYVAVVDSVTQAEGNGRYCNYKLPAEGTGKQYVIERKQVDIIWATDTLSGAGISAWEGFTVSYCRVERHVTASIAEGATSADDGKAYEIVSVNLTNDRATNVGTYTATVDSLGNANYTFAPGASREYIITKVDVANIAFIDKEVVFNGEEFEITVNTTVTQFGDTVAVNYTGSVTADYGRSAVIGENKARNAGVYTFTASVAESTNYNAWTGTAILTVSRASLSDLTVDDVITAYDNTAKRITLGDNYTYGSDTDILAVEYTIYGTKHDGTTVALAQGNSATDAGKYVVTVRIDNGYKDENGYPNANYVTKEISADLIINAIDMNLTTQTMTGGGIYTYKADYYELTATVASEAGEFLTQYGHTIDVVYSGGEAGNKVKNVGSYTVSATLNAGNNYNETVISGNITIKPKEITVNWTENDFTYNGTDRTNEISPTLVYGAIEEGDGKVYDVDEVTISVTVAGKSTNNLNETVFYNAGDYTATVLIDTANYSVTNSSRDYTMKKCVIDGIYFTGYTVEYNGTLRFAGVSETENTSVQSKVTSVRLQGSDEGTVKYKYNLTGLNDEYTMEFNGARYAGTYYVQATIEEPAGYDNYYDKTLTATLIINRTSLSGFDLQNKSVTYNGEMHSLNINAVPSQYQTGSYYSQYGEAMTLTYRLDGMVVSVAQAQNVKLSGGTVAAYEVTATFEFSGTDSDLKKASYVPASLVYKAYLLINQATISGVTFDGLNVTYDGAEHTINPVFPATVAGVYPQYSVNGSTVNVILSATHNSGNGDTFNIEKSIASGETEAVDAKTYVFGLDITPAEGTIAGNYKNFGGLSANLVIAKANIADSSDAELVADNNIFFENVVTVYNAAPQSILLASARDKSTVTTDPVLTWKVYPFGYSTANPIFAGEDATVEYLFDNESRTSQTNVGVYNVVVKIVHKNYNTLVLTATLTIEKYTINYSFVDAEIGYDGATHYSSVSEGTPAYVDAPVTSLTFFHVDTATVTYTYTSERNGNGEFNGAVNADVYTITASITVNGDAASNYNVWESMTRTLTIVPVKATVVWSNAESYVYNGKNQGATIGATFELVNGVTQNMTVSFLGTEGKATGETEFKNAGTYTATASFDSYNYLLGDVNKEFVIQKYTVNWNFISTTITYAAKTKYLLVNTVNGAKVSDDDITTVTDPVTEESLGILYSYSTNGVQTTGRGARNAGVYSVTARLDNGNPSDENYTGSNYNDWNGEATFTIERQVLTGYVENIDKVYDGTVHCDGAVLTGIYVEDSVHLRYEGSYDNKNVGTNKPISIVLSADEGYEYLLDNYIVSYSGSGSITTRVLTPANSALTYWSKVYDGTVASVNNPITVFSGNQIVEGDDLMVTASYNSKNVLEANAVVFGLSGADTGNYSMDSLVFDEVDFKNVFLITALSRGITWSNYDYTYNGKSRDVIAYINVVAADSGIAGVSEGRLMLTVDYTYTNDGEGNAIEHIMHAAFRNAGTYTASAVFADGVMDENMKANYGITSSKQTCTIAKASIAVVWTGLGTYTYNGTDQHSQISISAALLGDDIADYADKDYIILTCRNALSEDVEFRNAGKYSFVAGFNAAYGELSNNYNLTDTTKSLDMEKAVIDNISFSGIREWTYYSGETNYFYVATAASGESYATENTDIYYKYDADMKMKFMYTGGDSNSEFYTENGVKNTGEYDITVTVASNSNYHDWNGTVHVVVEKGTIDNIYLVGYGTTYDTENHYVFISNKNEVTTNATTVVLPDGTNDFNVEYGTAVLEYADSSISIEEYPYILDFARANNYACAAGKYFVNARIINSKNYKDWGVTGIDAGARTALLQIEKATVSTHWIHVYAEDQTRYVYNGEDQTGNITAYITKPGSHAEDDRTITLKVNFAHRDTALDAVLRTYFVVAGIYDLTAGFLPDADEIWNKNNYALTNDTEVVEMYKFDVDLKWYYDCDGKEDQEYDGYNLCVYDKRTHAVRAVGLGLPDADGIHRREMTLVPDYDSEFSAINAGNYIARVSAIGQGDTDKVTVKGVDYVLPYEMNYQVPASLSLAWKIEKRPIGLTLDIENSHLVKIYDGNSEFTPVGQSMQTSVVGENNTITKVMSYNVEQGNYSGIQNVVVYKLTNIISEDAEIVSIAIKSIYSNKRNVLASNAVIVFGDLVFKDDSSNYYIDGDTTGLTLFGNVIEPMRVNATVAKNLGHVYNGKTYENTVVYEDEIYRVADIDAISLGNISELHSDNIAGYVTVTNRFIVSYDISGAVYAGSYDVNFTVNLDIVDNEGAHNYAFLDGNGDVIGRDESGNLLKTSVNSEDRKYVISKRKLDAVYSNLLQSFNGERADVGATLNLASCDLTDMEWGIVGYDAMSEEAQLQAKITALGNLLVADGVASSISGDKVNIDGKVNNTVWKAATFIEYTNITANETADDNANKYLTTDLGEHRENYNLGDNPILQLTYLTIKDVDKCEFNVTSINDIANIRSDYIGMKTAYINLNIGGIPKYVQINDISGLSGGEYFVLNANTAWTFESVYNGGGYAISDFVISAQNIDYVGLFGRTKDATISDLSILRVNVAASNVLFAGGLVGFAEKTTIRNVTVSGTLSVKNTEDVYSTLSLGMIAGKAVDSVITQCGAVGYIDVRANEVYGGGIVGQYVVDVTAGGGVTGNVSFVDGKYKVSAAHVGGIAGSILAENSSDNVYLKNGTFVTDGNTGIIDNGTNQGTGYTYSDFRNAANGTLLAKVLTCAVRDMMRSYSLLPDVTVSADGVVVITTYRQLALMSMYGWLNFKLGADIYIPSSMGKLTYVDSFYGNFEENGYRIYSGSGVTYNIFTTTAGSIVTAYRQNV